MARLRLNPEPTFKAKVSIPVPGSSPASVEFTFKHKTRAQTKEWIEGLADGSDTAIVQEIVVAWELDDEFTPENVARLCENYLGAAAAILSTYLAELRGAREKN